MSYPHKKNLWIPSANYLSILGIILFLGLYLFAASLYPGGSQSDLQTEGFDWLHNYWCNLLNETAMNGDVNPARPYAIIAMVILCASLMLFFISFAITLASTKTWKAIISIFGVLSMIFAIFIFTKFHDIMTTISSIFGLLVVIGIIREIYKSNWTSFKYGGVLCIILLGFNNLIYYTQYMIELLPILQKITFAIILIWILGLNILMIKKIKLDQPLHQQEAS